MAAQGKTIVLALAKAVVSIGLLTVLLISIDTEVLLNLGKQFSPWLFVPLVILFVASLFLSSWRWQVVLKCHALNQSILRGVYLYLVGFFYNNFLPTAIGGDVVRGYEAGRSLGSLLKAFSSILMERILGLLATLTVALLFLPVAQPPMLLLVLVLSLNAVAWGGALFFVLSRKFFFFDRVLHVLPTALLGRVLNVVETVREYRSNSRILSKSFLITILQQGAAILICWIGAYLAGVRNIPIQAYFVLVPLVWIVSMIPISLNALGVREISFAYFFGILGGSEEQGILVSLIFFGTTVIASLIGGVLWGFVGYDADKNRWARTRES